MAGAITPLGKLVIADDSGFTTNVLRLDFVDWDSGITLEFKDMNGTRGKYTKDDARVRQNRTTIFPRVRCQPTAVEMSGILKWATGGTPSGSGTVTYPLGNTATARYVWYLPNNGTGFQLSSVAVDNMTIRGSSGEPIEVEMDLVGQTYAFTSSSYPSTALDLTTKPYIFSDLVLTTATVARNVREMSVMIRNNIDRTRFLNSLTLTALQKLKREVTMMIDIPAGDYDAIWDDALSTGVASVATFTGPGTQVLVLTVGAVRLVPKSPSIPFQQESFLRLEGELYSADGSAENLIITNHE